MRIEQIGQATLYHGDCLEVADHIRAKSVDLVLTDPPYTAPTAVAFGRENARSITDLSVQAYYMKACAGSWKRVGTPFVRLLVFCDDDYYPVLHTVFYPWPFRQMAVWDKGRIGMGRGFRRRHELIIHATSQGCGDLNLWDGVTSHQSVLSFAPVSNDNRVHGAQKPLELMEYLVRAGSDLGETVFDPFMGSGTTGVACAKHGRRFIGIEADEQHFETALRRIEAAAGNAGPLFGEAA
jgi:site-specific DNA-methyltransferase (adenine-specific)